MASLCLFVLIWRASIYRTLPCPLFLSFYHHSASFCFLLSHGNSTAIMLSSSTGNDQLTASAPSRIGASRPNITWKDIIQAGSCPILLPSDVERPLLAVLHVLQTNDLPSPQDAAIIPELVRLLDNHIARLDPAMDSTLIVIPHIMPPIQYDQKTLRTNLQYLRDQVNSVNSAVRRIPQEIWEEVFLFVRALNTQVDVFNPQDSVHAIGQVCQQWRRVSHSYPWLWNQILVVVPLLRVQEMAYRTVRRLRKVLERSRDLPLDFVFKCNCAFNKDLLSLLMQQSLRWRSAGFLVITTDNALLLDNVHGRVPQLESLTIHLERGGFARSDEISAFEIAPKLARVDLCYIRIEQVVLDPSVRRNIRSLRVGSYPDTATDPPSLLNVLQDFRNLTDVDFCCRTDRRHGIILESTRLIRWDDFASQTLIAPQYYQPNITWTTLLPREDDLRSVHEKVTSLRLGKMTWLDDISLPNLVSLDVGYDINPRMILNEDLLPSVISLLRHSHCCLVSLHLHGAYWGEGSMGTLLGLVPDLETLAISSGGMPSITEQMCVLTRLLGESERVPRLKTMCISLIAKEAWRGSDWKFVSKVFLDMIGVRAERGALETVRMRGVCARIGRVFPQLCAKDRVQWDALCGRGLIDAQVVVSL